MVDRYQIEGCSADTIEERNDSYMYSTAPHVYSTVVGLAVVGAGEA